MIYFDNNKEAYLQKETIKKFGLTCICEIENEIWKEFSSDKAGTSWNIVNGEFLDLRQSSEYIQQQAQKERERINKLTVTKRIFALALEQFGVTYTQLKEVIASNERATLEWDLCVELERGNPLLDQLAPTFNITSEQLDYIFKVANGEIIITNESEEK